MPTFSCPARCKSCGSAYNKNSQKNLPLKDIIKSIDEAKTMFFENIVFTGGEATLRWNDLLEGIKYSSQQNLRPRLVTNAHWAKNQKEANARLQTFITSGLCEINFSTGDEHVKYIPFENIIFAILATLQNGLDVHIMIEYKSNRTISKNSILNNPLIAKLDINKKNQIRIVESPWMPLNPFVYENYPSGDSINDINITLRSGCKTMLQSYVIQSDGRIGVCCGIGMSFIKEFFVGSVYRKNFLKDAIKIAESDFLKLWIRYKGPESIIAWAANKDSSINWQNLYAHNCQACLRIYNDRKIQNIILKYYEEIISDVIQSMWFDEIYYPNKINQYMVKNT